MSQENTKPETWAEVLTENQLLKVLGIPRASLDRLRNEKGFPYVRVTQRGRVYLVPDVLEWLVANRRNV